MTKTAAQLQHEREDFLGTLQVEMQTWLGDFLDRHGPRAKELDMAIGHVGHQLGSGVASSIYELYRDKPGVQPMSEAQRQCLEIIKDSFIRGYDEKTEILKDTVLLANAMGLGHTH